MILVSCIAHKSSSNIQKINYRIINGTAINFTDVSLFSDRLGNLNAYDTIGFNTVFYNSLKHDPLLYCKYENTNYGRYLMLPNKQNAKVTYIIDSIQNKIVYIGTIIE
tara:strand:- start:14437 stop:14760 length:324 start_codon:yes stop_codon:yes gene_type:complete